LWEGIGEAFGDGILDGLDQEVRRRLGVQQSCKAEDCREEARVNSFHGPWVLAI
jgi:hypothetical protein